MMFWKVLDGYTAAVSGTNYRYPGKGRWTKHLDPDKLEHYKYGYHVAEDENLLNHLTSNVWNVRESRNGDSEQLGASWN